MRSRPQQACVSVYARGCCTRPQQLADRRALRGMPQVSAQFRQAAAAQISGNASPDAARSAPALQSRRRHRATNPDQVCAALWQCRGSDRGHAHAQSPSTHAAVRAAKAPSAAARRRSRTTADRDSRPAPYRRTWTPRPPLRAIPSHALRCGALHRGRRHARRGSNPARWPPAPRLRVRRGRKAKRMR